MLHVVVGISVVVIVVVVGRWRRWFRRGCDGQVRVVGSQAVDGVQR